MLSFRDVTWETSRGLKKGQCKAYFTSLMPWMSSTNELARRMLFCWISARVSTERKTAKPTRWKAGWRIMPLATVLRVLIASLDESNRNIFVPSPQFLSSIVSCDLQKEILFLHVSLKYIYNAKTLASDWLSKWHQKREKTFSNKNELVTN